MIPLILVMICLVYVTLAVAFFAQAATTQRYERSRTYLAFTCVLWAPLVGFGLVLVVVDAIRALRRK